jgi:hypothetical protein
MPSSLIVKLLPRLPNHEVEKFRLPGASAMVKPDIATANVAIEETNAPTRAVFPSFIKKKEGHLARELKSIEERSYISPCSHREFNLHT